MKRGMVLGKFMPLHAGHLYLIDFARAWADELAVVVGTMEGEPIPGALRHRWVQELRPQLQVLHLHKSLPQKPEEHPDFWRIWQESLLELLPWVPDLLFASEEYGQRLAEVLGAKFVPLERTLFDLSGTAIRADPWAHWAQLPEPVQSHYRRSVCIFGPESTGKSSLTAQLAREWKTIWVPEYARIHLEAQGGALSEADILLIAQGQRALEEALWPQAGPLLFCDTDLLSTVTWSEQLYGSCPAWILDEALNRAHHLYLLLDIDVPWIADPVRYLPDERRSFFERSRALLERYQLPYLILSGSWEARRQHALEAVAALNPRDTDP